MSTHWDNSWDREKLDFNYWIESVKHRTEASPHWKIIGEWVYPTKSNTFESQTFLHLCRESHAKIATDTVTLTFKDYCCCCHKPVPDGVKMVTLLTESL